MDLKQIKELMSAMEKAGIKKLTLKDKAGFEIHLERQEDQSQQVNIPVTYAHPHAFPHPHHHMKEEIVRHSAPASTSSMPKHQDETTLSPEKQGKYVTAPLVGTYYNAPSPDDPPFIKVGDRVEENTVICIIEAMKVMNEVKAGISGILEEILVENAHPVEFGTKMFRIV